jgi:hypothetical protein
MATYNNNNDIILYGDLLHKHYINDRTVRLAKFKEELAKLELMEFKDSYAEKRIIGLKRAIKSIQDNIATVEMYQSLQRPYGM